MKKNILSIISSILLFIFIWGCDDNRMDLDIKWIFEPEVQLAETAQVDISTDLKLKINSTVYKQGYNEHFFQFVGNKNAVLISPTGDTIRMNKDIKIPFDGEFHTYKFVGKDEGIHDLKFLFRNSKDHKAEVSKKINMKIAEFSFDANSGNIGAINVPKAVTVILTPPATSPKGTTYKFKYKKGGELAGTLKDANGKVLEEGVLYSISSGNNTLSFIPTTATDKGVISFVAVDSYGKEKEAKVMFKINQNSFDFDAKAITPSALVNSNLPLSFKITPADASTASGSYKMKFSSNFEGTIAGYKAGEEFEVSSGAFELNYKGLSVGEHTINITAKDNFGTVINRELKVSVNPQTFSFTAVTDNLTPIISSNTNINFNVTPATSNQTFKMKYQMLEGKGVFYHNGEEVSQNNLFVIERGDFSKTFKPTTGGNVKIKVTVVNQDGYEVTQEINYTVNTPEFTFTASALSASQTQNTTNKINFILTPIGNTPQDFQIKFEDTGEAKINGYEKNTWFEINSGNGSLNYVPASSGQHTLKLIVKSKQYNVEQTQTINIEVELHDFTFTAINQQTQWTLETPKTLSFNIDPIGNDVGMSYSMSYKVTQGQGVLEGFNPSVYQAVNKGSFNIKFTPKSQGAINIEFSVKNSDGTVKTQTISLNIESVDFSFSTTSQANSTTVGTPINVAYNLEPIGINGQTYEVKFETSGDGQLNGYNEGVWFPVSSGSGTFQFKPTSSGQHQVTVTARSNFGISKTATFNVNVDIQKFDFVVAPSATTGVINTNLPINFTISPVGNDAGQTYQMRYIVESGSGSIEGMTAGTWFVIDKGNFSKNYLPTTSGAHKITFYAKNTAGTEITKTVDLSISQPDFNFSGVPIKTSSVINEEIDVNFNLEAIGDDLGSTYQMSYTSTGLSTLDGNQQNILFPVSKGNFTMKYKALAIGNHAVTVKLKNKFGVEKTATFTISVSNYDFAFTAVANNASPVINTATPVSMNITPIGVDPNVDYFIKYEILAGQGVLENFNPGIYQPVSKGNFSMNFKPTTAGDVTIRLTTKNSAGSTHEQMVKFMVSVPDFNFSTTSQANSTTVGTPINVAYNLEPIGINGQTYEVKFETSGDGQLGYNSNFNNEGVWFPVSSGSGTFQFKPTSSGQHQVTVTARSNFGVIKTTNFTTNVITPRFDFSATPSALQFVLNQEVPINMNITPIDSDLGLTYDLKYEITSGSGTITGMTPGVFKTVATGDFNLKFTSSQSGNTAIKFTARNSAGTEVVKTISLNTISAQFTVTATNLKNTVYINTPVTINYSIDNLGLSQNYELMMTTDGTGTIDGKQEGVWYSISNLTGQLEFTPTSLGNHQVVLNFRNQFGVIKSINLNLTSVSQDFTFTATSNQNDLIINQLKTLDFNITPATQITGIDYFIKYEILQGSATVNGMQPNTYISASTGNWNNGITPTAGGQLTIKFTAKNSNGLLKEQTLNFNVQTPNFALNGNYQPKNIYWRGDNIDINYMISQFISQEQTFEYTIESNLPGSFDGGKTLGTWHTLNSKSGNLQFMPNAKGSYSITVKVKNQYGEQKQFSFSVNVVSAPIIDTVASEATYSCTINGWSGSTCQGNIKVVANNGGNIKITKVKVVYGPPDSQYEEKFFNQSYINELFFSTYHSFGNNVNIEVTNEFGDVTTVTIPWRKI